MGTEKRNKFIKTERHKPVSQSVSQSVRRSVRLSVGPSVGRSVGRPVGRPVGQSSQTSPVPCKIEVLEEGRGRSHPMPPLNFAHVD